MNRQNINYPETQLDWDNLPQQFKDYLDSLDEAKNELVSNQKVDPLYPSYDYEWELDEEIPFRTILEYWNSNDELPEHQVIFDEINDCMAEAAYDYYVSSFYSY